MTHDTNVDHSVEGAVVRNNIATMLEDFDAGIFGELIDAIALTFGQSDSGEIENEDVLAIVREFEEIEKREKELLERLASLFGVTREREI